MNAAIERTNQQLHSPETARVQAEGVKFRIWGWVLCLVYAGRMRSPRRDRAATQNGTNGHLTDTHPIVFKVQFTETSNTLWGSNTVDTGRAVPKKDCGVL